MHRRGSTHGRKANCVLSPKTTIPLPNADCRPNLSSTLADLKMAGRTKRHIARQRRQSAMTEDMVATQVARFYQEKNHMAPQQHRSATWSPMTRVAHCVTPTNRRSGAQSTPLAPLPELGSREWLPLDALVARDPSFNRYFRGKPSDARAAYRFPQVTAALEFYKYLPCCT